MSSHRHSPLIPVPILSNSNTGSSSRQIGPEVIPEPPDRWHPKITAYRLIIVLLGISLGSAKAWMTWRGETIASITLEWISGVVVSLCLFILGWYDNSDGTPTPIFFLFSYDCLDILWRILSILKPAYRSDEPVADSDHPTITGYRIMISAVVSIFGVIKMICSYVGLNTAANAIDWVFVTIISTSLYLLGLYEENPCNVLPFLFTTDYSGTVAGVTFYLATCIMAPAACILWIYFWFEPYMDYIITPLGPKMPNDARPSSIIAIYYSAIKLYTSSILLGILFYPIIVLLILFWHSRLFPPLRRGLLFLYKKTWLYSERKDSHPSKDRVVAFGIICMKIVGRIALSLLVIAFFASFGIIVIGTFIDMLVLMFYSWPGFVLIFGSAIFGFACLISILLQPHVQSPRVHIGPRRLGRH